MDRNYLQYVVQIIPYQHYYFTLMLPFLRFSWTIQSIIFVIDAPQNPYNQHVTNALAEQVTFVLCPGVTESIVQAGRKEIMKYI